MRPEPLSHDLLTRIGELRALLRAARSRPLTAEERAAASALAALVGRLLGLDDASSVDPDPGPPRATEPVP